MHILTYKYDLADKTADKIDAHKSLQTYHNALKPQDKETTTS